MLNIETNLYEVNPRAYADQPFRRRWPFSMLLAGLVILAIMGSLTVYAGISIGEFVTLLVAVMFGQWVMDNRQAKAASTKAGGVPRNTVRFSEDRLYASTGRLGYSIFPWSYVTKAEWTANFVRIYIPPYSCVVIPGNAFKCAEDLAQLERFLKAKGAFEIVINSSRWT
jgi:hypothetical protein